MPAVLKNVLDKAIDFFPEDSNIQPSDSEIFGKDLFGSYRDEDLTLDDVDPASEKLSDYEEIDFESDDPVLRRKPGIWPAPESEEKSLIGRAWEWTLERFKDEKGEEAKKTNAITMAEEFGISPSEAYDNLDALTKEVVPPDQPSFQELVEGLILPPIVLGLLLRPLPTAIGVGTYMSLAEIENALISLHPDVDYEFMAGKGVQDLLSEDVDQRVKDTVWVADTAWKAIVAGGIGKKITPEIHKYSQLIYAKFMKDVSARYELPKSYHISPEKIRAFHGKGNGISRVESDMLKDFGLTREQYVDALKQGVDIEIPASKFIDAVDKPWWAAIKKAAGVRPYRETFPIRAEPIVKTHMERLPPPLKSVPKARPVKPEEAIPESVFTSLKGHKYEKIGDKWYGSKGREVSNIYIIRAAEKGKVAFETVAEAVDKVVKKVPEEKVEPTEPITTKPVKLPPEKSPFRQDPEVTGKNLELLPEYKKIDTPEQFIARIENEINKELDDGTDAGVARRFLNDLNVEAKIWASGEETPKGIFDDMNLKELTSMSEYLDNLDSWAKETEKVEVEPEIVYGKILERPGAEKDYNKWYRENKERLGKELEEAEMARANSEGRLGLLAGRKIEFIHKLKHDYGKTLKEAKDIADDFYEGRTTIDDVRAILAEPVGKIDRLKIEPSVTLGMGLGGLFSDKAIGKRMAKVPLYFKAKLKGLNNQLMEVRYTGSTDTFEYKHPRTNKWLSYSGLREELMERDWVMDYITKPKGIEPTEPTTKLYSGFAPIQEIYDKLTTGRKAKIKLPVKLPDPFPGVKEEAREAVFGRRARLDTLNYEVNKFVNKLEYGYSEKQLEAAYFAIEKTKVPGKLNRPDLEKVLKKDKEILNDIAKQVKHFHGKQWAEIKKVWPDLTTKQIEDYITHLYDIPRHKKAEAVNWFSTFARSLEPRHIPTMEMAIEKGFIPKTLNVAEIIKINSTLINKAIANTEYIKALLAMERDGVSLIQRSDKAPLDWIEVDYHALTRRIPLKKGEAKKKGEFVKEVKVRVHPDLVRPLKVIFEERFDHPIISAYEAINGVMKKSTLSLALFHHGALGEVGVALIGPFRTANIYFNPVKIFKAFARGEFDAFTKEAIARDSIMSGVQYGATADIPIHRIQRYLDDLARVSSNIPMANKITSFMKGANSAWDKALWMYLHDTLKLYGYEALVGRLNPRLDVEQTRMAKREVAQFINDTFGGQNWDTLMMTPKEVQMLTWPLLSMDWTISTTRQALALTGIGKVYKETAGLRRKMGRRFWARAGLYFGIGVNLLNVMYRKKDIEENPQYYKDKDYSFDDKTMFGNTIGKSTYLFDGRYEDGTERYVRWGKQFRDFFELFVNPLKKLGGKAAPLPQLLSEMFTGHTLSGFKNDDIYKTKGLEKAIGIIKTIAKSPLPISVKRYMREDMEFKLLDIVMQSTKGMSRYSAMEYLKKAIVDGDEETLRDAYVGAIRNNLPAYTLFTSALSWAEAEATASLAETVEDIEDVRIKLDASESTSDRKRYGKILSRLEREKADKMMGIELLGSAVERARIFREMELGDRGPNLPR